jgi:hypothetical protein
VKDLPKPPPHLVEWVKLACAVLAILVFIANAFIRRDAESLGWLLLAVLWVL